MKKTRLLWTLVLCLGVSGMAMTSCSDDDNDYYPTYIPNAIVTVKSMAATDSFYMQLDDSTTLSADNMKTSPYGKKEVRAFTNIQEIKRIGTSGRHYLVHVNWMDSILTKNMAADKGENNVKTYCQDPVEVMRNWTVSEDGYLTMQVATRWSGTERHIVNLVNTGKDEKYEVTFYHDAKGETSGKWGTSVVAFRLDQLPDTKGKTVDLTLKWMSYSGEKSATFKYCTRKSSQISTTAISASGNERVIR